MAEGKNVKQRLDEEYGEGFATFCCCDVTNTDEFKGNVQRKLSKSSTCLIFLQNARLALSL